MMYELTIHTKKDTYNFAAHDYCFNETTRVLQMYDEKGWTVGVVTDVKAFFAREVRSDNE